MLFTVCILVSVAFIECMPDVPTETTYDPNTNDVEQYTFNTKLLDDFEEVYDNALDFALKSNQVGKKFVITSEELIKQPFSHYNEEEMNELRQEISEFREIYIEFSKNSDKIVTKLLPSNEILMNDLKYLLLKSSQEVDQIYNLFEYYLKRIEKFYNEATEEGLKEIESNNESLASVIRRRTYIDDMKHSIGIVRSKTG